MRRENYEKKLRVDHVLVKDTNSSSDEFGEEEEGSSKVWESDEKPGSQEILSHISRTWCIPFFPYAWDKQKYHLINQVVPLHPDIHQVHHGFYESGPNGRE